MKLTLDSIVAWVKKDFWNRAEVAGWVERHFVRKAEYMAVGEWTIALTFGGGSTGLTTTTNVGRYKVEGNKVTAWGRIQLSAKGSSTGTAVIGGLPFAMIDITGFRTPVTLRNGNMSLTGVLEGLTTGGSTSFALYVNNNGVASVATNTHFANNTDIAIELTYLIP